jgi:nitrogen fixation/metabolism regulation signal transduction histidine kinase
MWQRKSGWQYLQTVIEASNRGKELVRQIVTFSRQKEQEHKTMQIVPLVKEALKFLRASLPASIEIRESIFAESALTSMGRSRSIRS